MKKIIPSSVFLLVYIYSTVAFAEDSACIQLGMDSDCRSQAQGGSSCDEACQARAEAREALEEARRAAEASRQAAEASYAAARDKEQELTLLRKSIVAPTTIDEANRRYSATLKEKENLSNQLDSLQKKLNQNNDSLDAAVYLNEEDLYKKVFLAPLPWMYQQAKKNFQAQQKELDDLQEQSRYLSTLSSKNDERIRVEKQIQLKSIFGLGLDLLDVPAPAFKKANKTYKTAYAAAKSAVALMYTATAPDYIERTKKANESVNNLIILLNQSMLNPTWTDEEKAELSAAVRSISLSLKTASFVIDQNNKDDKNPVRLPSELYYDYIKQTINMIGVYNPYFTSAHALISLKERTDQYVRAENAIKQIRKMKEAGLNAEQYINDRILQVKRNLEASQRIIKACQVGGCQ